MMADLSGLSSFRIKFGLRELFYAFLCVVLGYLLRVRDSYSLNPVWRKRSELSKFSNAKFPTQMDRCPTPIITDLEGDGVNEIVLVSNDLAHINVLAVPLNSEEEDRSLAHMVGKHKTDLNFEERIKGFRPKPYVVAVGFTTPYLSMMQIRKQAIVVVTDDWQVSCFDPSLNLLWKQQLPLPVEDLHDVEVKSLSALVSPLSIDKNHQGLVIIAGNFKHKSHKPDVYEAMKEREKTRSKNRTVETQSKYEMENLTHFSTFALSTQDGSVLWKHVAGDFQNLDADNASKEIHWKLRLRHNKIHSGESPWSDFGDQLDPYFPHSWSDNSDTEIIIARVTKEFGKAPHQSAHLEEEVTTQASALLPEHFMGFSYGGQRPHSSHEHVHNPNSLVIRSPDGLQVLSLVTGQPKTVYRLPTDRAIYADMDGDGHMEKMVWDAGQHYSPCYLDIWRTHPVQEKLDQIVLCSNKRLFWVRSWSLEEDVYHKIPPRIVKSVSRKSGILRHFLGHNLFEDNTYDIIAFGGMGRVSSFAMDGNIHWQTSTESKWADLSLSLRKSGGRPMSDEVKEEFLMSFHPDRVFMPLVVSGRKVALAVSGMNSISVVDLVEGTLLAEHSLPAPPTGPLVYGDFDNDGITDIVVTCKKGYIGFAMKLKHNYEMTVLYTVAVFLIIVLFSWFISSSTTKDDDSTLDEDEDYEEDTNTNNDRQMPLSDDRIGGLYNS